MFSMFTDNLKSFNFVSILFIALPYLLPYHIYLLPYHIYYQYDKVIDKILSR